MPLRSPVQEYQYYGHKRTVAPVRVEVSSQVRALTRTTLEEYPQTELLEHVSTATAVIEELYSMALLTQTWRLSLDAWPGYKEPWWDGPRTWAVSELNRGASRTVILPRYPLQAVSNVSTFNNADEETVVNVSDTFYVDTDREPGRLGLRFGQTWPVALRDHNAIEITYTAGYGNSTNDVPPPILRAVSSLAAFYYEHRIECEPQDALKKSGALDLMRLYKARDL